MLMKATVSPDAELVWAKLPVVIRAAVVVGSPAPLAGAPAADAPPAAAAAREASPDPRFPPTVLKPPSQELARSTAL
jgi:hypothetical protein